MSPGAIEPAAVVDRDALTKRAIPLMVLSNGSESSRTAAPKLPEQYIEPKKSAEQRFAVTGNAVITGGTGTLGMSASRALLEHGLSGLMVFDIKISPEARKRIELLKANFPSAKIETFEVDVTDDAAVAVAVENTVKVLGSVNTLFCFAGVVGCVDAMEMTASQWRRVLDINLTGAFVCAQACARHMKETGGSITFIASISAHRVNFPQPQCAYNVSKAGLITLKNCLAAEWAQYGIRTNTISPGYMDTVLNAGDDASLKQARDTWAVRNPSGRMGVPSELTGVVVLLASAASTYINGADLVVDGGQIVF